MNLPSLKLYHIGSTSVPELCAKPIIDIAGSVDKLEELDSVKSRLEDIGYVYKGSYGISGRRYCVLYNSEETHCYCHLHIFKKGHPALVDHLAFRDYLRLDAEAREKYQRLKKSLDLPRNEYTE